MTASTFSLSWEAHRNNICNGLGVLQQNGEFVDMTLAADGHFVKVHKVIMALASPFFKDLISSAEGKHPVIFLNKTSSTTLCAILEYIYTGEVSIGIEQLSELLQAGKELHIKGLQDMNVQDSIDRQLQNEELHSENANEIGDEVCYFEIADHKSPSQDIEYKTVLDDRLMDDSKSNQSMDTSEMVEQYEEVNSRSRSKSESDNGIEVPEIYVGRRIPASIQYTVSNQGSLQMILNRYVYYLKHCNRNNSRQWRCVDYLGKLRCPAIVMTMDNVVKQRFSAHTHGHHDKRILKKLNVNAVFTQINDAEHQGNIIKDKIKNDKSTHNVSHTGVLNHE